MSNVQYTIAASSTDSMTLKVTPAAGKKVAIDPGHGDKNDKNTVVDPGAVNGSDYEKDIALLIAKGAQNVLTKKGHAVVMTRSADVVDAGTKLEWRIDAAAGCDLFVSIHNNASDARSAHGFSVCYKKGDAESKSLAQTIQDANTLFSSRGLKERQSVCSEQILGNRRACRGGIHQQCRRSVGSQVQSRRDRR